MDKNEVGNKYKILDAKTGEEKKGRYFCLRIDANNPKERETVNDTLRFYASRHEEIGNPDYAASVRRFIGE